MGKKILIISSLIVLLIILIVLLLPKTSNTNNPSGTDGAGNGYTGALGVPVNLNGWLVCLPRTTLGTACVTGLQAGDGKDYALLTASGQIWDRGTLSTGSRYNAIGNLVAAPDSLKNYKIQGTIQLAQ